MTDIRVSKVQEVETVAEGDTLSCPGFAYLTTGQLVHVHGRVVAGDGQNRSCNQRTNMSKTWRWDVAAVERADCNGKNVTRG